MNKIKTDQNITYQMIYLIINKIIKEETPENINKLVIEIFSIPNSKTAIKQIMKNKEKVKTAFHYYTDKSIMISEKHMNIPIKYWMIGNILETFETKEIMEILDCLNMKNLPNINFDDVEGNYLPVVLNKQFKKLFKNDFLKELKDFQFFKLFFILIKKNKNYLDNLSLSNDFIKNLWERIDFNNLGKFYIFLKKKKKRNVKFIFNNIL
jgi:hypothetical protein